MTVKIIKYILSNDLADVFCWCHYLNIKLINDLKLNDCNYSVFEKKSYTINPLLMFVNVKDFFLTKKILFSAVKNSDSIILVQGSIELGCEFLLYAHVLGIKIKSYIPFAHKNIILRNKFSSIRDWVDKFIYKLTNEYITISEQFRGQLIEHNRSAKVFIANNFVDAIPSDNFTRSNRNNLELDKFNVFIVGRLVTTHKCQDLLLSSIHKISNIVDKNVVVHIIGSGFDLYKLKGLASIYNNFETVFHGWCDKWWELSARCDLLVIPSRFEGVPLVMLEAIANKVPVIASKCDGMLDYLHDYALFDNCNEACTIENLSNLLLRCLTDKSFLTKCSLYKISNVNNVDVNAFLL